MERLRGVPLTDLAAIQRVTDVDPESILVNALNTWFGSVLACETFHADMYVLQPAPEYAVISFAWHAKCSSLRVVCSTCAGALKVYRGCMVLICSVLCRVSQIYSRASCGASSGAHAGMRATSWCFRTSRAGRAGRWAS